MTILTQPGRKPRFFIFRAWYERLGVRYWAKDYGYKAWRIPIY
jgi:hypothetical protein